MWCKTARGPRVKRKSFDLAPSLKPEFQGSGVPSDAGLLADPQLDDGLRLVMMMTEDTFDDCRNGENKQHTRAV